MARNVAQQRWAPIQQLAWGAAVAAAAMALALKVPKGLQGGDDSKASGRSEPKSTGRSGLGSFRQNYSTSTDKAKDGKKEKEKTTGTEMAEQRARAAAFEAIGVCTRLRRSRRLRHGYCACNASKTEQKARL